MPSFGLNFVSLLFQLEGNETTLNIMDHRRRLLNIPIQCYGEEYVERYVDRFGTC